MKLREITQVRENPLAQQQAPATKAAGAVKQVAQKVGQGAKMAAQKMGGKGTGGMMAKGLDKLASGGALTGNLSKQIAPFAKQLSTILADTTLRNKFMMLVKQAEAGAKKQAPAQPQMQTQSMEEDPSNDEVMKDKIKAWSDKYDGYIGSNGDSLPEGYVEWALNTGIAEDFIETNERDKMIEKYGKDKFDEDPFAFLDEMPITKACMEELEKITGSTDIDNNAELIKKHGDLGYKESMEEAATPGATSAGAIATVANPITAYAKVKKDGKGVPKADQKKTPKGTAVNALDMKGASLFGGNIQKR